MDALFKNIVFKWSTRVLSISEEIRSVRRQTKEKSNGETPLQEFIRDYRTLLAVGSTLLAINQTIPSHSPSYEHVIRAPTGVFYLSRTHQDIMEQAKRPIVKAQDFPRHAHTEYEIISRDATNSAKYSFMGQSTISTIKKFVY